MDRHHVLEVLSDALVGPLILNFLIGVLCSILASILVNFFVLKAGLCLTAASKTRCDIPLRLAEKFADSTLFCMDFVILSCCVYMHQQLKHAQQGTFLYIALMTVLLLQRAPNPAPGIICSTSALFMAFSYYTFLHRFRWEQLEFSEIPAKVSEGAPEVPRVYGHYKQPELPPPKQKENTRLQRAATTMRMRVNTCCDVEPERRETRHKTMPH
eukprot:g8029.t1